MNLTWHDPTTVPAPRSSYTQALEVRDAGRTLFIGGQIPETRDRAVPAGPEEQCRQVWRNIVSCLESARLNVTDLVQVRVYLSDRSLLAINTAVRNEFLGDHRPAMTIVIAALVDPRWLLEIDAVAVAA